MKLQRGDASRLAEVESVWLHDGEPVLKFLGLDSISDAEAWEHADILVREPDLARPQPGEFLHADLIGCAVWEEGAETALGTVRAIQEFGGPALLEVDADGREVLIPLARSICVEIDVERKIIRARLPAGLIEL